MNIGFAFHVGRLLVKSKSPQTKQIACVKPPNTSGTTYDVMVVYGDYFQKYVVKYKPSQVKQ